MIARSLPTLHGALLACVSCVACVASVSACVGDDPTALAGAACDDASDCGQGLACVDDVCVPGGGDEGEGEGEGEIIGCVGADDGDSCSDGDPCTDGDACAGDTCVGTLIDCGAGFCSEGSCVQPEDCVRAGTVQEVAVGAGLAAQAAIAYNGDDDEIGAVYSDTRTGLEEIFFVRLTSDGARADLPVQLTDGRPPTVDDPSTSSAFPSIVYNPDQNEYGVAWDASDTLLLDVFFSIVTRDGAPLADGAELSRGLLALAGTPSVLWTGAQYGVAWTDTRNSSETVDAEIFFELASDSGQPDNLANTQMSSVPTALDFPRIVFNPRRVEIGLALTEGGTPNSVRFVRTDDGGQPITSFTISDTVDSAQLPSIALTPTGYALAWEELGPDSDGDGAADTARVVVATVTDEGDPASLPRAITGAEINGFDPSIVAVAGGLAVSFATVDGAGTREVRVQRLALDGTPAGSPIVYATGVVRVRRTWAAGLPDGSVAVSWEEGDQDNDLDVKAAVRCLE